LLTTSARVSIELEKNEIRGDKLASVTPITDAYNWNLTRISEAFGLSRDTVRKRLREAGVTPADKRGNAPVYKLSDVGPALFSNEMVMNSEYTPDKMPPKDRKEWFQSENERVKFQTNVGDLIPVGEHRDDLAAVLKKVSSFFDSLPDKMERRRTFTPEQLTELERASDDLREMLYRLLVEVGGNG
jgi:hypothetical protein